MTERSDFDAVKDRLLDAILPHVAFDGWSETAFVAATHDAGIDPGEARRHCRRGAADLAIAFHERGDAWMLERLTAEPMNDLKIREKIARAIRVRLDVIEDKEAVRRGAALFALPHMAGEGARLVWNTADAIWDAIGDPSDDLNWYTKRAILSGVWSATLLYWLGDVSPDHEATDAFVDRRIANVMQFEKMKAQANQNRLLRPLTEPLGRLAAMVKAPSKMPRVDLPGSWISPDR